MSSNFGKTAEFRKTLYILSHRCRLEQRYDVLKLPILFGTRMNINVLINNGSTWNNKDTEASRSRRCYSYVIAWNRMDPDKISTWISFVVIIENKVVNREFHSLVGKIQLRKPAGIKKRRTNNSILIKCYCIRWFKSCNNRQYSMHLSLSQTGASELILNKPSRKKTFRG
jgi:hypothetical protein